VQQDESQALSESAKQAMASRDFKLAQSKLSLLLARDPFDTAVWFDYAQLQRSERDFRSAIETYRFIRSLSDDHALAWINEGLCHHDLLDYEAARHCYEQARIDASTSVLARWYNSYIDLELERYETGWSGFMARHDFFALSRQSAPGPKPWHGEALQENDGLLIHAREGLGDAIQGMRFLPTLVERYGADRLALELPAQLLEIFRLSFPPFTAHAPPTPARASSVANILGRSITISCEVALADVPAHCWSEPPWPAAFGYLKPKVADHAQMAALFEGSERSHANRWGGPPCLRIGLAFRGNSDYVNDHWRSLSIEQAVSFAASLTARSKGYIAFMALDAGWNAELAARHQEVLWRSPDVDIATLAGVLKQLDLVVSVDTMIAHLAGALGSPCALLLPHHADWRWLGTRDDSPWYQSMRLYRQSKDWSWATPLAALERDLLSLAAAKLRSSN
jgi:tetratricopeptide (TPR) repeat protein